MAANDLMLSGAQSLGSPCGWAADLTDEKPVTMAAGGAAALS
jgi:hypothetical protein